MSLVVHILKIEYCFPKMWWELRYVKYEALSTEPDTEAWCGGDRLWDDDKWAVSGLQGYCEHVKLCFP